MDQFACETNADVRGLVPAQTAGVGVDVPARTATIVSTMPSRARLPPSGSSCCTRPHYETGPPDPGPG